VRSAKLMMMEKNVTVGKYAVEYAHQTIGLYLYLLIGFLVPFTIGQPQEIVGMVVNATLVLGALEFASYKQMLPLLFAPSLGVLARGLIFGPFTPFLAIMLPFIWISNAVLVFGVRELYKRRETDYLITLGAAALAKSGFLFLTAFALVSLSIVPVLFLTTMGIIQLLTALAGGALAYGLRKSGVLRLMHF